MPNPRPDRPRLPMKRLLHLSVPLLVLPMTACADTSPAPSAAPEVRGTWMTTTANQALADPANIEASMRRLREIGLNTVYVETWKNGYTQFPSAALERTVGVDRHPDLRRDGRSRDLLEESLIEAHRNGLLYLAWFEYGFMAALSGSDNALLREKREWLSEGPDGNLTAPNGFIWMNPLRPEVRRFLLDLILDAVRAYDLDGIQLDDRLAWPHYTMGYDAYTREAFAREHDGRQPPEDPRDAEWTRWRADKVTEFAEQLERELRAERPDILLSVSPAVYPWSYANYACDWPAWAAAGWFDEYIPQVYRFNYEAYARDWDRQLAHMPGRERDLIAGIRLVGDGPDTTWPDMEKKMTAAARGGGHVHWFSRGVLDVYPEELKAWYAGPGGGFVPHPKRPADWRPAPLVARAVNGRNGLWEVDVESSGTYRVVARANGGWREVERVRLDPGRHRLEVAGVRKVELLVDRRPTPGG
ncbi:MAG: hypothetical protein EA425_10685 [Puniceicoccaceae bacterium]|nr:MAG: hypothetical protein EA425_10685 [Puniceicoccaceae bacterium]